MPSQTNEPQFQALKALSVSLGSDPLQVQGAGGNTSIKIEDTLWIKASGKWLANAKQEEMFVPVALPPLLQALADDDPRAEKSTDFVVSALNESGLRPSIETTVHAVLNRRIVIHIHCVDTIAIASLIDAEQQLNVALQDFNWLWVPYYRPGLPLSKYISEHQNQTTDIVVLGNHGLVVAADSVSEAATLLEQVRLRLKQNKREQRNINTDALNDYCADSNYVPVNDAATHNFALDQISMDIAAAGSLYPDHVIFLGDATQLAMRDEPLADCVKRITKKTGEPPTSIVIPDKGVLIKADANPGQHAMACCIYEVTRRLNKDQNVRYLTEDNVYQLLNWEAEHYRQNLNANE